MRSSKSPVWWPTCAAILASGSLWLAGLGALAGDCQDAAAAPAPAVAAEPDGSFLFVHPIGERRMVILEELEPTAALKTPAITVVSAQRPSPWRGRRLRMEGGCYEEVDGLVELHVGEGVRYLAAELRSCRTGRWARDARLPGLAEAKLSADEAAHFRAIAAGRPGFQLAALIDSDDDGEPELFGTDAGHPTLLAGDGTPIHSFYTAETP